jgi:WS/DGAT/MGAT family acyltransferase
VALSGGVTEIEGPTDLFMRDSDAFSWYMERDPALRSTIVAVAWLDSAPDWDAVCDTLERATRAIPLFRMTVAELPVRVATPHWSVDDDFDLAHHLRRLDAPAPRTPATVIDVARLAAITPFDLNHPLWEFTLVGHLDGDRAALVMKVHHSLTDGIGGMELALQLFDREPSPVRAEPMPPAPDGEPDGPGALFLESLQHDRERLVELARREARGVVPGIVHAVRHPLRTAGDVLKTARSIAGTVAPVSTTLSPIMTGRGLGRRLEMCTMELADLKRAAAMAGGSVNDGFMAGICGGLRRYHGHHDTDVEELRVTLPISIRTPSDPTTGNHITLQRFTLPVDLADPVERIRAVRTRCRSARDEPAVQHTEAIAGALNLLPPSVVGSMLKHVDFLASNVPGFTFPVYLGGARMTGYFPFGPTIGAALNVTLLTYAGTCCIGVTVDTAAVPDPEVLLHYIAGSFEEILDLGGAHEPVSLPLHDSSYPGC